ncbi:MAG: hypothetical protein WDZ27_02370 [Waddliaceae bacterium]
MTIITTLSSFQLNAGACTSCVDSVGLDGWCDRQEYCTDIGGCGYRDSYASCCITPAVAFGAVALGVIIAVAFHNNKGAHDHVHCD